MATADPFESVAIWEHVRTGAVMVLITGFLFGLTWVGYQGLITNGTAVTAEVLQFGTYPASKVAGGDLPVLTLRLDPERHGDLGRRR